MVSSDHIQIELAEDPDNPYRLGRNVNHDPRSSAYPHARRAMPIVTRDRWPRGIPILDQSNLHSQGIHVEGDPDSLGSCVANTGVAAVACANVLVTDPRGQITWLDKLDVLDQRLAIAWYRWITTRDPFHGSWPPDDTGSDGTTMAESLRQWGIVEEYRHAFGGLYDVLDALMTGGVMMGSKWMSSMFNPTRDGFIEITPNAWNSGGHEYWLNGRVSVEEQWVEIDNSWNVSWGDQGRAKISWSTLDQLLGDNGDATILKFRTFSPEPPPFPVTPAEPTGCLPSLLPASLRMRLGMA
jgi:hypothetical protein